MNSDQLKIKKLVKYINNWPKPNILFRDITPILHSPNILKIVVNSLCDLFRNKKISHIGALEARGFIFGSLVAYKLKLPLVLFRKPGKLPGECLQEEVVMEYGNTTLELKKDNLNEGDSILLIDDILATGGTILAAAKLAKKLGAEVVGAAVMLKLNEIDGEQNLKKANIPIKSIISD